MLGHARRPVRATCRMGITEPRVRLRGLPLYLLNAGMHIWHDIAAYLLDDGSLVPLWNKMEGPPRRIVLPGTRCRPDTLPSAPATDRSSSRDSRLSTAWAGQCTMSPAVAASTVRRRCEPGR